MAARVFVTPTHGYILSPRLSVLYSPLYFDIDPLLTACNAGQPCSSLLLRLRHLASLYCFLKTPLGRALVFHTTIATRCSGPSFAPSTCAAWTCFFFRYLLNNFFDGYKQDCFTFFFQAASYPNSSFETELVPPKRFHAGLRRVLFESVMLFLFLLFVLPVLPSSFVFSGVYGAGYRLTEALLAFCSLPFQIVLRVLSTLLSYTFLGIPFPSILRPFAFPAEGLLFESLIGADGHWSELLKKVGGFIWLFTFSLLCSLAYIFIRAAAVVSVPQLLPDSP